MQSEAARKIKHWFTPANDLNIKKARLKAGRDGSFPLQAKQMEQFLCPYFY